VSPFPITDLNIVDWNGLSNIGATIRSHSVGFEFFKPKSPRWIALALSDTLNSEHTTMLTPDYDPVVELEEIPDPVDGFREVADPIDGLGEVGDPPDG